MFLPSAITDPHDGSGGRTPAPMNDRLASSTMASATMTVQKTRTGAAQLATTCLTTMCEVLAPMTFSAAT